MSNIPKMGQLPTLLGWFEDEKTPFLTDLGMPSFWEIFHMSWVLKNPSVAPFDPVVAENILKHMLKLGDGKIAATYFHYFFWTYAFPHHDSSPAVRVDTLKILRGYHGDHDLGFYCHLPSEHEQSYHLLIPALANKKPWIPYLYNSMVSKLIWSQNIHILKIKAKFIVPYLVNWNQSSVARRGVYGQSCGFPSGLGYLAANTQDLQSIDHWIGLMKILQDTSIYHRKNHGFLYIFPAKPIQWVEICTFLGCLIVEPDPSTMEPRLHGKPSEGVSVRSVLMGSSP